MLKGIALGIVLGLVLVAAGLYFYFSTGQAPVTTKSPEMPFEHKLAHMALDAYLNKMPHTKPQVPEDEHSFLEGARVYRENCAVCHGLPGETEKQNPRGHFPRAAETFSRSGRHRRRRVENFRKVRGGNSNDRHP